MILKHIEYDGAEWTVVSGPRHGESGTIELELVFVRDGTDGRVRYARPVRETELLKALHRDPTDVDDELLRRLLAQAIADGGRMEDR